MSRVLICGPMVCNYPNPRRYRQTSGKRFPRWRCPYCKTRYVLTRPKPRRWWRRGGAVAPHGYWRLPFFAPRRTPTAALSLDFIPRKGAAEATQVDPPMDPGDWVPDRIPDA